MYREENEGNMEMRRLEREREGGLKESHNIEREGQRCEKYEKKYQKKRKRKRGRRQRKGGK